MPTKVRLVKPMVLPVVMYGCESWTIKKAECQRIDAFELWCWRRLLRVLWTARRSNKSILKEISPEYSLEGLILKLKLLMIQQKLAIWSLDASAFYKSTLHIGKFSVHVLLKPRLKDFEHNLDSTWNECNCRAIWAFFGIVFLGGLEWELNFPVPWLLLSFPNLLAYWLQHFNSIIF